MRVEIKDGRARNFAVMTEEFKPSEFFGYKECQIILSEGQALELCRWLNEQLFRVSIKKISD